mmetsp:Transcript_23892/g.54426  ORF Transcript_23892/g.54426 Transcript_23892/m.54426 type:complete len:209 (-) Transcript_23892:1036-1662(-)
MPPGVTTYGVLLVQLQNEPAANAKRYDMQILVVAQGVDHSQQHFQRVHMCWHFVPVRRHCAGLRRHFVRCGWLVAVVGRQHACLLEEVPWHSAGIAVYTCKKPSRQQKRVVHTLESLCYDAAEGVGCITFGAGQKGKCGHPVNLAGGGACRGCTVVLVGAPRGLGAARQHLPMRCQGQVSVAQAGVGRRRRRRRRPQPLQQPMGQARG